MDKGGSWAFFYKKKKVTKSSLAFIDNDTTNIKVRYTRKTLFISRWPILFSMHNTVSLTKLLCYKKREEWFFNFIH